MTCPPHSDQSFGPVVNSNCRFDFTLEFEDAILTLLPAAIFICSIPFPLALLVRRQRLFALNSRWLFCRLTSLAALIATQLAIVGLRNQQQQWRTPSSLAADIFSSLATVATAVQLTINHQRSIRSSTLLSLYLSLLTLFGAVRARTFWLIDPASAVAGVQISSVVLTALILLLECMGTKRRGSRMYSNSETIHGADTKLPDAPEQYSAFWNRTIFSWLTTTLREGYVKVISLQDIPVMDTKLESIRLYQMLVDTWAKYDPKAKNSLIRACFRAYSVMFFSGVLPRLCLSGFTFAQPFLLNTTVSYVGQAHPDKDYGKALIGAWALVFIGLATSNSIYQYQSTRFSTQVKGGLIALIYQRGVQTRTVDAGEVTAVTLMGTDVQRISMGIQQLHEMWASVLDVGIAIWLLERQLSIAAVAPIVIVLIFVAITAFIAGPSNRAQRIWIEQIQTRLRVTSAFLDEMKAVKMQGLSQTMANIVTDLRRTEISRSEKYRKIGMTVFLLSFTPISLAPVATFAVYVILSVFWHSTSLLAAKAFTSLTLISLLTTPINEWVQYLPQFVQCFACFDRIQEYCNYSKDVHVETDADESRSISSTISLREIQPRLVRSEPSGSTPNEIISFENQSFAWKLSEPATLKNLNVSVNRASIVAVAGSVGSGKTTMLESILGETFQTSGVVLKNSVRAAYCAQQPWLEHTSIRQNILGISPHDSKWYDTVVSACCLEQDLSLLPKGDRTAVGSKGLALSGGQKQRIALARAVYSRQPLVLLDDVFSGMDARTVDAVARGLLGSTGLLRKNKATVIIATHNRHVVSFADSIITLEDGKATRVASPVQILRDEHKTDELGLSEARTEVPEEEDAITTAVAELRNSTDSSMKELEATTNQALTDLRRKNGDFGVYKRFFASLGPRVVIMYTVFLIIFVFCNQFPAVWLKWWTEANEKDPDDRIGMYMGVFAMFGIVGTIATCISSWFSFIEGLTNAALRLHGDILDKTIRAPFHYFSSTDTGEILNRFSEDMQLVDMNLFADSFNYSLTALEAFAQVIIILIFSKYLGAAVPIVFALLYFLQRFYLQTSRQMRLLGIEAQAPLYTSFNEADAGAVTIRAFGWESEYRERNAVLIDNSQRPAYMLLCIQHWLGFVLDVIVTIIVTVLATVVIVWREEIGPGAAGVSLVMIVGFNQVLARLIRTWTSLESSIGAVARVKRFVEETESEPEGSVQAEELGDWPSAGAIKFEKVVASHKPDGPPVLKYLSLTIPAGQHTAICGRTGSGKTSLILTLLHMLTVQSGRILLDGVDLSTLGPETVRAKLNVVSQDALLLPGSIRFNVDPFKVAAEGKVYDALQRVGLWETVLRVGGLDKEVVAEAWSAGQKQLLCLARAMVRGGKVLVLDEAASNVDSETEARMQEIIDKHFKNCTVLSVVHRLGHISSYDKVQVLDGGEVLEYGNPAELAASKKGEEGAVFAELLRHSRAEGAASSSSAAAVHG